MDCSEVVSIWLPPKTAVRQSALGHYLSAMITDISLNLIMMFVSAYVPCR